MQHHCVPFLVRSLFEGGRTWLISQDPLQKCAYLHLQSAEIACPVRVFLHFL